MTRVGEELARKSIGPKMFSAFLGVSEKTAWNKMQGFSEFTVFEALKIKKEIFPEYDLDWLFADVENHSKNRKK